MHQHPTDLGSPAAGSVGGRLSPATRVPRRAHPARMAPVCVVIWERDGQLHALGGAVRELRARRRLSQEGLGRVAGTHRNYVGAIERGEINPTFRVLCKLAHGLRVPLTELVEVYERHRDER